MARPFDLDSRDLLTGLVKDARTAWFSTAEGPAPPRGRAAILAALRKGGETLPVEQRAAIVDPLEAWLAAHDDRALDRFLNGDPNGDTGAFLDLLQAVAQRAPKAYEPVATAAFQELVSDLYDGYLSAQDRRGARTEPDSALPPLVRWGNPADGPYTWPVETLATFGVGTGIVNLPPAYARGGLAAWASLGHETCGHDVLNAFRDLLPELRRVVSRALDGAGVSDGLTEHWMRGFEEAAADVMGVLNLGPSAALADLAFFRACYRAGTKPGVNMKEDPADEHPLDLLRVYLGASVVRGLRFAGADEWASTLEREARQDTRDATLRVGGREVPLSDARTSAAVFARAMTSSRLDALDQLALGEVQNWRDADQRIAERKMRQLAAKRGGAVSVGAGEYAAHVMAGALMGAMQHPDDVERYFLGMRATLARVNARNPAWKPGAMVRHRGDVAKHRLHARRATRRR